MRPLHSRRGRPPYGFLPIVAATVCLSIAAAGELTTAAVTPAPPSSSTATTPAVAYAPPLDAAALLAVDRDMRRFFEQRISSPFSDGQRLHEIIEAIVLPDGLGFMYDAGATYDAATAFRRRRGNCVTFAFLIVAVTREFGFQAAFQNVDTVARWDRYGELIASVQHVNVRIQADDGTHVVDLRPDLMPAVHSPDVHVVDDAQACASFYTDHGFFRLVRGDSDGALRFMVLATQIGPHSASAWANRATLHARLGDLEAARRCYERSLRLDGGALCALVGFVDVLHRLGTPAALAQAAKLERRAQTLRDRNPYYHEYLAWRAAEIGAWEAVERRMRQALALKRDDPDFLVEWIMALEHLGRTGDVTRATARLEKIWDKRAKQTNSLAAR